MNSNLNIFTRTCEISEGEEVTIDLPEDELISKIPQHAIDYVKGLTVFANDTYMSTEEVKELSDGESLARICGDWYIFGSAIKFVEDGYYVNLIEHPEKFYFKCNDMFGKIIEVR
jgi:hypothetical protein